MTTGVNETLVMADPKRRLTVGGMLGQMTDDEKVTSAKAPVGIGWRVEVARGAVVFFSIQGHAAGLEALRKTDPPQTLQAFTVLEFIRFLGTKCGGNEPGAAGAPH